MTSVWWWLGLVAVFAPVLTLGETVQPPQCAPRESFPGFVAHFKRDGDFRASRILFPLAVQNGAAWNKPERVSRSAYRDLESFPLVTPEREAELAGGEGELCESTTGQLDSRDFMQSSCDTDVYGHVYHFERIEGCWALTRVELGGS